MKNKDIILAAEKYIESAEKDTYAIRKAFIDGAKWMQEQKNNNLSLADVSGSLTAGDVERINKTPIWNFLDWLTDNNKIEKKSLLWDHMNTYIKGVIKRFKEAEKVNGR